MTRRKPLPYHANWGLDKIKMEATEGLRMLKPLLKSRDLEVVQRTAAVIENLYEIGLAVDDIQRQKSEGSDGD